MKALEIKKGVCGRKKKTITSCGWCGGRKETGKSTSTKGNKKPQPKKEKFAWVGVTN